MTLNELIARTKVEYNALVASHNADVAEYSALMGKHRLSEDDQARADELRARTANSGAKVTELSEKLINLDLERIEDETITRAQSRVYTNEQWDAKVRARREEQGVTTMRGDGRPLSDGKGYLSLRRTRNDIRTAAERAGGYDVRALLAVGTTATGVEILDETPVSLGKPATSLLDLIPARTVKGGQYSYLRQTVRTNNAAPVAVGGTKPTSVFTLERVTGELEVVAHLSEAIHEPWLSDAPALDQFVQTEMVDGIGAALDDQILNGTGVSPELAGIIATGTGTQAYATSPIVTIRTAIAQLEAAGLAASAIILASSDWLAIETATVTGGAYLLGDAATGAPLDRIKRTLWGVPVVVSAAHTAGTAVVLAQDSVGLVTDGGVDFVWGRVSDDFSKNQVRGRAEIRAQVEVYRPSGIIVCDLTA